VGKTRVAIDIASRLIDAFPAGVCFVDLSGVGDPSFVLLAIAQTLGIRETTRESLRDDLAQWVGGRRLLIVLDNFEHLLVAAPDIAYLLAACADLKILITSRQPLRLRIERECPVLPLELPLLAPLPSVDRLALVPAVDLFVRRAGMVKPDFTVTAKNARDVAEIAVRLDGLPLALELAATRIKVLSPSALLEHLNERLEILVGGARDLPERQQTLRATLDWSHSLLSPDEQQLFRRLAVYADGFTLNAAEAVAGDRPLRTTNSSVQVLDLITSLVDKSLLRVRDDGPELRFGMLETVREYALEQLLSSGEFEATRARFIGWCLNLSECAEPELSGADQERWIVRLQAEHGNLRAAINDAADRDDGALVLRFCASLWRY
jgi:predicted ATPase